MLELKYLDSRCRDHSRFLIVGYLILELAMLRILPFSDVAQGGMLERELNTGETASLLTPPHSFFESPLLSFGDT
jgi:hypothetical protein